MERCNTNVLRQFWTVVFVDFLSHYWICYMLIRGQTWRIDSLKNRWIQPSATSYWWSPVNRQKKIAETMCQDGNKNLDHASSIHLFFCGNWSINDATTYIIFHAVWKKRTWVIVGSFPEWGRVVCLLKLRGEKESISPEKRRWTLEYFQ